MSIGASDNRRTSKSLLPNRHKIEPPLNDKALGKVEKLLKKRDVGDVAKTLMLEADSGWNLWGDSLGRTNAGHDRKDGQHRRFSASLMRQLAQALPRSELRYRSMSR